MDQNLIGGILQEQRLEAALGLRVGRDTDLYAKGPDQDKPQAGEKPESEFRKCDESTPELLGKGEFVKNPVKGQRNRQAALM
jgi:hypothetical protein